MSHHIDAARRALHNLTCADCGDVRCPLQNARGNHIVPACVSFKPPEPEKSSGDKAAAVISAASDPHQES